MTYIIAGGSSGLGRALAERFAAGGYSLVLLSTDERDTCAIAADLELRYAAVVRSVRFDLAASSLSFEKIDATLEEMAPLEGLLLPAGAVSADDEPGIDPDQFDALLCVNFISICKLINHYLPRLQQISHSAIIGFGSIASARGRKRNAAYAAAKTALNSYFESLRHSMADSSTKVQFYINGYLDTNLAFAEQTPLPAASPERLADLVFKHRQKDIGQRFFPRYWYFICGILKLLPWVIFRRLSF